MLLLQFKDIFIQFNSKITNLPEHWNSNRKCISLEHCFSLWHLYIFRAVRIYLKVIYFDWFSIISKSCTYFLLCFLFLKYVSSQYEVHIRAEWNEPSGLIRNKIYSPLFTNFTTIVDYLYSVKTVCFLIKLWTLILQTSSFRSTKTKNEAKIV
jgi:hypothetical protein